MIKAYKYKIKPNDKQQALLSQFFGCTRFIYNWGLERKTSAYKTDGSSLTYMQLAKDLTNLKKEEEYKWLGECTNEALQQSLRNLESAYTAFFRKKANYPNFKSKHKSRDSVKFINSVHFDFEEWKVKLPKLGWVKLCKNRIWNQATCKQGTVTVSKDKCGDYWLSVVIDNQISNIKKKIINSETAVGIDLGIKDYAILSDGTKYNNHKYLQNSQKMLAHWQKNFARTKQGSKRHEKARIRVAKCYRGITNQRTDFLQKLSTDLVKNYDTICLEDLNVKGMEQNHNLAKAITDAAWSEFVRELQYKSEWYGNNIVFIGRFEPSSKLCHNCGYINTELKLSDREWVCPRCGEHLDRDINAAINIKRIALEKQNLIGIE